MKNNIIKKFLKIGRLLLLLQCLSCKLMVNATSLESTKLVQGTLKLIDDATTVAMLFIGGVTVVCELVIGFKYMVGEEDEKPKFKKTAKITLAVGILIICVAGLVNVVFGYFR